MSALAPKRVIDTFIRVTESRNASRGGAYRYLLLEIEKVLSHHFINLFVTVIYSEEKHKLMK